ncbi:MAG TPA: acyl-CoA dehydrogenase family protein, partial [Candidatus Binataceae bacterium]|nr:acyl-CoA dehydrogenase family protein [Candidatus Binataceae bacterium]
SDSREEAEFRTQARQWLERNKPASMVDRGFALPIDEESIRTLRDWQRRLYEGGYLGISWPAEYGGQGRTIIESAIFNEEMARVRAPAPLNELGLSMGAPTILEHGTDEQKHRYIRKILTCEEVWCQGFSEPASGSDLAALGTRAVLDGDEFVVNGQKVWTSLGHIADWCMLLVRTDSNAPKHRGISYLLVDMHSPGITVQPLKQMTGEAEFNQMFFEDVRVPRKNLLGPLNGGWGVAITTLMNERATLSLATVMRFHNTFEDLAELARRLSAAGTCPVSREVVRQTLAQFYVDVESMKYLAYRNFSRLRRGGTPGPEGSISKVLWSELNQRMNEFALMLEGPRAPLTEGSGHAVDGGRWQYGLLRSRGNTIEEGTSEIQRGIIAERLLGLPKGY